MTDMAMPLPSEAAAKPSAPIKAIAQASKKDDYRLRTVIENFVMSDLFQKR